MKNTITTMLLLLSLMFAGCDKMNTKECQQKYDEIMDNYNRAVFTATQNAGTTAAAQNDLKNQLRIAASTANYQASQLLDCQGWQKLSTER